jgi:hypothetical protein
MYDLRGEPTPPFLPPPTFLWHRGMTVVTLVLRVMVITRFDHSSMSAVDSQSLFGRCRTDVVRTSAIVAIGSA